LEEKKWCSTKKCQKKIQKIFGQFFFLETQLFWGVSQDSWYNPEVPISVRCPSALSITRLSSTYYAHDQERHSTDDECSLEDGSLEHTPPKRQVDMCGIFGVVFLGQKGDTYTQAEMRHETKRVRVTSTSTRGSSRALMMAYSLKTGFRDSSMTLLHKRPDLKLMSTMGLRSAVSPPYHLRHLSVITPLSLSLRAAPTP